MSPRLLLLAASLMGKAPGRSCNDYDLPSDLSDDDVRTLADLANRDNFGDRPREEWPDDDVMTPKRMRPHTYDFVVMGALAQGLREMAAKGGAK